MKDPEGKVPYHLVPVHAEEGLALAFGEGAKKYAVDDWKGLDVETLIAAAKRHLNDIRKGEVFDPDPAGFKLQHAYKAMASCAMISELIRLELEAAEVPPVPSPVELPPDFAKVVPPEVRQFEPWQCEALHRSGIKQYRCLLRKTHTGLHRHEDLVWDDEEGNRVNQSG